MKLTYFFALVVLQFSLVLCSSSLESLSDDDLVHLIKTEDVVVLFTKKDCNDCDAYETHLLNLEHDIKENLEASVVKAHLSQMVRLYSPTKEPALVYFRHGIPLLYDGPITDDAILQKFIDNKTPAVKELSDSNFEHLTQASSGATTGDWFILFYSQECVDCQRLGAVWEAVGAALKNRVNVARMNRLTTGYVTAKRFGVLKSPEYLFIRQGKFYRYQVNKYEVKAFVSFAQEWYRNARAERVPVPSSPFDDFIEMMVKYVKITITFSEQFRAEYPYLFFSVLFGFIIGTLYAAFSRFTPESKTKKEKNKKAK